MAKFKVGDSVRVIHAAAGSPEYRGKTGAIISTTTWNALEWVVDFGVPVAAIPHPTPCLGWFRSCDLAPALHDADLEKVRYYTQPNPSVLQQVDPSEKRVPLPAGARSKQESVK